MIKKCLYISCLLFSLIIKAEIKLPHFFSDHMVLQQNEPIAIYGTANTDEAIIASFHGETLNTVADSRGNWSVTFKAMKAGGPFEIILKGTNTLQFTDVYVGEVWFCSGQSNMGWKLENSVNGEQELTDANYEKIKLFNVPREMSGSIRTDISKGTWETCTSENAEGFSAVAYFFGKSLYEKYKVPIGLINSSWGGTNIEAWMDESFFEDSPERQVIIKKMKSMDMVQAVEQYNQDHETYSKKQDQTDLGTENHWESLNTDYTTWKTFTLPSLWRDTELKKTYGVVWVTKEIKLSKVEGTSNIELSLGRIDDEDVTYFNGTEIGASTKKDFDRVYMVPKELVKVGTNRITIKTKNLLDLGGFRSAKSDLFLNIGESKIPLAGEWCYKVGTPDIEAPPTRVHPRYYPTSLYNSMVHPFFGYNIKGVIWYQGESNTKNPEEYAVFFPQMIKDWRTKWKNEVPFLFVQLANYANQGNREAAIREAQASALKLPKTAMVVTLDIGEDTNVHFPNKQDVGKRLAMAAQHIAYGEVNVPTSGPLIVKVEYKKGKAIITFDTSIVIKGDETNINGFLISENNTDFEKAKAIKVNQYTIEVYNENVKTPHQVRYLWEDAPGQVMIFNESGLPAPPFRDAK